MIFTFIFKTKKSLVRCLKGGDVNTSNKYLTISSAALKCNIYFKTGNFISTSYKMSLPFELIWPFITETGLITTF